MRLSVVIPALNEAKNIGACLASVRSAPPPVEVVVVDGGSDDDTVSIASAQVQTIVSQRGRAEQMNAGARATSGDVVLFLHADTELPRGWYEAIEHELRDLRVAGGTFRLRFDRDTPLLRMYAWCTRFRWRAFHYGDQGIFVRRAVFASLGGFAELPLMEDVDFLARLARAGRVALSPLSVTTSSRRFDRHGVVKQQLLNTALVAAYIVGISPTRLARWYDNARH